MDQVNTMSPDADAIPKENTLRGFATRVERRRPDRMETINPVLTPLLRGKFVAGLESTRTSRQDDLAPAKGLLASVFLGLLLWILIEGVVVVATK